jgi:hypothetical protein
MRGVLGMGMMGRLGSPDCHPPVFKTPSITQPGIRFSFDLHFSPPSVNTSLSHHIIRSIKHQPLCTVQAFSSQPF